MQNAPREHSAILSTFIRLPFVFKTFVLSIFEWPLKTGLMYRLKDETPIVFVGFVYSPSFVVQYYVSFLVLQSYNRGREFGSFTFTAF